MAYIISQAIQWLATCFRASGMLAKDAKRVKYLVSLGNLCFAIGGVLDGNIALVASNVICLMIMVVDIVKNKKEKNGPKTFRARQRRHDLAHGTAFSYKPEEKVGKYTKATISLEEKPVEKVPEIASEGALEAIEVTKKNAKVEKNMAKKATRRRRTTKKAEK